MRSTWLMELLEEYMDGESVTVYLHRKMAAGWTLVRIKDDLGNRTGQYVSLATLSKWTRDMGYSKLQAAESAWQHGLIGQAVVQSRSKRNTRAQ